MSKLNHKTSRRRDSNCIKVSLLRLALGLSIGFSVNLVFTIPGTAQSQCTAEERSCKNDCYRQAYQSDSGQAFLRNCLVADPTAQGSEASCAAVRASAAIVSNQCSRNQCNILPGRCEASEIDELDQDSTDIANEECRKIHGIDSELCRFETNEEIEERRNRECYESFGPGAPECETENDSENEQTDADSDIKVCRLDLGEFDCGSESDGEGSPVGDDGGEGSGNSGGRGSGGGSGSNGSGGGSGGGGSGGGGGESPPGPPTPPDPPGPPTPPGPPIPPGPPGPPTPPAPPGPFGGGDGGGAGICLGAHCNGGGPFGGGGGGNAGICLGRWCATGDPHLVSADGVKYDFQAVGEFIFAKSETLDTELQLRLAPYGMVHKPWLEPYGSARYLSVISALALKASGSTLTVDVRREPSERIHIDGVAVDYLEEESVIAHESGFTLYRHSNHVHEVWTPQNVRVKFASYTSNISLDIAFPFYKSRSVTGLLGARDDDPANDFVTRGGEVISHVRGKLSREDLYDRLGNSWRISQAESLFDYTDGESTATFTNMALPEKMVTLADLTPQEREQAERICRDAGVGESPVLDDCIYDVGFSGDSSFAQSYAETIAMPRSLAKNLPVAKLSAPESVVVGSTLEVHWTGPSNARDYIALASPGAEKGSDYLRYTFVPQAGEAATLQMPGTPGNYELRYVLNRDREIIARRSVTVTQATVNLMAPDQVEAGATVDIEWAGPANARDFIALAVPGAENGGDYLRYTFVSPSTGAVSLQVPGTPGDYELRYVLNSDRTIVERRKIRVTQATAKLIAPDQVEAGATVDIEWAGPANARDFIALAVPGAENGGD
ncbi:MAG: VWD domain-containing protein, partial [Pseudomonadota bacterium]